jgi:hypothetical protein
MSGNVAAGNPGQPETKDDGLMVHAAVTAAVSSRRRAPPLHAGLALAAENRAFMAAGMLWLLVSAAVLAWNGTLLIGGAARPAALHVFTVGFVLSLIYGLAAHMLPRFTGNPVGRRAWSWVQFVLLESGLLLFVAGFSAAVHAAALAGAVLLWLSTVLFALRMWPVLWPRRSP